MNNMRNTTKRLLAKDVTVSCDTWQTRLNNNTLIIGVPGSGKTRGYIKPNILLSEESMVIADTKGNLYSQCKDALEAKGYTTMLIDFRNAQNNSIGYNPLDYIRYDEANHCWRENDILTISQVLVPDNPYDRDPFWNNSARLYMSSLIAYVMECLPKSEHTLEYVMKLNGLHNQYRTMGDGKITKSILTEMFEDLEQIRPNSYAVRLYRLISGNSTAEKMEASIRGILNEKFNTLNTTDTMNMFKRAKRMDFTALGKEKTAVFVYASDVDRSKDRLGSLFYTQMFQTLTEFAGECEGCRLPVPVHFYLDDFAANIQIPDFDNIASVIRSREISVSIVIQSISQLTKIYGTYASTTILNNMDHIIYMGGNDLETAKFIANHASIPEEKVLRLPIGKEFLLERGSKTTMEDIYEPES